MGGCATSGALTTSTENDGVYYSSSDHTTSSAPSYVGNSGTIPARALDDTTPATAATTDDANPDYQGGTTQGGYAASTDYYSNTYNSGLSYYTPSGFNQPYTGPGVSSYNYTPAVSVSPYGYGSPFGYGAGLAMGYGYSPFSYGFGSPFGYGYPYGGFYNPFYSPFGYGAGLSIGFGYGFGGFGSPYGFGYSPFGYGYGYPYGYSSFYGRGYGYDAGYARPVIYTRGAGVSSPGTNAVLYGSRNNRGGAVMNAAPNPNAVNIGSGRGSYTGNAVALPGNGAGAPVMAAPTGRGGRAVTFGDATGQPTYSTPASPGSPTGNAVPTTAPAAGRRGFFSGFFGNGSTPNPAAQPATAGQPANNGGYGSRQRSYGQPTYSNGQPSYNQPQRSYSQPTYSQPTYSQPSRSYGGSFGGGGGGGGSFGGGGRGRR
ncbi:hypothetical protein GCM10023172_28840 [Hymenobacter ginsengisoli]|uniref:Prolyl-tRNA synthetase n=1 Tax=Hymenobacter ginsengisoli TaxID=1051626 RepID=A0ABP8QL12_9BACT